MCQTTAAEAERPHCDGEVNEPLEDVRRMQPCVQLAARTVPPPQLDGSGGCIASLPRLTLPRFAYPYFASPRLNADAPSGVHMHTYVYHLTMTRT